MGERGVTVPAAVLGLLGGEDPVEDRRLTADFIRAAQAEMEAVE